MTTTNPKLNDLNEKGYTLYASFIPIILIIAIILGAGYFLLKGEFDFPTLGTDKTEVRRLDGFPTVAYTRDDVDKQRIVIKNEDELNDFFNSIDSTGQVVLLEDIDFEKEYLIGVNTENKETNGYDIKIKKLYADDAKKSLLVSLEESRPGENCEIDEQNNVALDLVAISKTDWVIEFERVAKVNECE